MKQTFKAVRTKYRPMAWNAKFQDNLWLNPEHLFFEPDWKKDFYYVVGDGYQCFEFKSRMDVLTFGKASLKLPFRLIALPVSIDGCGFEGSLEALIKDYTKRKGLFMLLNIQSVDCIKSRVPYGKTLSNCLFYNRFSSFDAYLGALRSPYRRRIRLALDKAKPISIEKIANDAFDHRLYQLYLDVLNRSKYPLETLPIEFFKESQEDIFVFYENHLAIAFVMVKAYEVKGYFLFGGMDYGKRDRYDLYYNMLIFIIKWGIKKRLSLISFGQTAESAKCRLGCEIEERYMCVFTKHQWMNKMIGWAMPFLEYTIIDTQYHVFK